MISVFLSELELHLHIQSLGQFVIFHDITGFERRDILNIISINLQLTLTIEKEYPECKFLT